MNTENKPMIVGTGDIARVLPRDRDDLLFFASGVSNSGENRPEEFIRELNLLSSQPVDKRLVYFSSLSVFYSETRYAHHKLAMEAYIKENFPQYAILRIGNITWGDNPHTLINFIRNKINNGEQWEARDEWRYIVEKEEFLHWVNLIPDFNCEINIPGQRMKVADVVNKYCTPHVPYREGVLFNGYP